MSRGIYVSYINRLALRHEEKRQKAQKDEGNEPTIPSSSESESEPEDEELIRRLALRRRSDVTMTEEMKKLLAKVKKAKRIKNFEMVKAFLVGILLTQTISFFRGFKREWNKAEALLNATLGFVLSTVMALSDTTYCIVLLMVPSFCTKVGRSVILLYIAFIITNGPAANIRTNYDSLTGSMTCGDELAFNATRGLRTIFNEGQVAVLNSMEKTVDVVVKAIDEVEKLLVDFSAGVKLIETQIRKLTSFIFDMGKICEKKLLKFFCIIPSIIAREAYHLLGKKINHKIQDILKEFRFTLNYTYDFEVDWKTSKSSLQIAKDITADINARFAAGQVVYNCLSFIFSFAFLIITYRAVRYRRGYLTALDYDNVYITAQFIKIDKRRQQRKRKYILPLTRRELYLYIRPRSLVMTYTEMRKAGRGLTLLTFNLLYAVAIFFADVFCYLLLQVIALLVERRQLYSEWKDEVIRRASEELAKAGAELSDEAKILATLSSLESRLHVNGDGFVSRMYNSILESIEQVTMTQKYHFSLDKCAPKSKEPDWVTYVIIFSLYLLCYLMCIFQSYILRSRRAIMASFNKRRELMRIGFLQAKIWKNRGTALNSDLSWLIMKAEKKSKEEPPQGCVVKCALVLHRLTGIWWFGNWAKRRTSKFQCFVCSSVGKKENVGLFERCPTPNCATVYCTQCFQQLRRNCINCLQKAGRDTSDESESDAIVDLSGISDSSASEEEHDETRV